MSEDFNYNIEHQPESENICSNIEYHLEIENKNKNLTQIINSIGHAVMDGTYLFYFIPTLNIKMTFNKNMIVIIFNEVSCKMATLQKELKIIKVDLIKNQELLIEINTNLNHSVTTTDQRSFNRSSLNIPIATMDELKIIDADEDKLKTLVIF